MEQVGLRELNQHASRIIERVKGGEVIEITEHGRPVARVVPIVSGGGLLEQMVRDGRVRPATAYGPFLMPPVIGDPEVSAADEVARMRDEDGR